MKEEQKVWCSFADLFKLSIKFTAFTELGLKGKSFKTLWVLRLLYTALKDRTKSWITFCAVKVSNLESLKFLLYSLLPE